MAKEISKGDVVNVVTAQGEHVPATVTKIGKNGCVDVVLTHKGEDVIITSCPRDDQGKKPDSWHALPNPPESAGAAPPGAGEVTGGAGAGAGGGAGERK